jgi:hypothetical protein
MYLLVISPMLTVIFTHTSNAAQVSAEDSYCEDYQTELQALQSNHAKTGRFKIWSVTLSYLDGILAVKLSCLAASACSLELERTALVPKLYSVGDAQVLLRKPFKTPHPNAPDCSQVPIQPCPVLSAILLRHTDTALTE